MELAYCFLGKFNNYFNRKIIKYNSIEDYKSHSKDFYIPLDKQNNISLFNFDPNDNVMTAIVCNDVPFDPDYFLLITKEQKIVQRWFVMEQKRNRQGQWLYTLKRDVISDNFNELLKSPIFVHKGMLPEGDPFIFNSEGMSFNQIKKSETLLKDRSGSAWVICYLAKSLISSNINLSVQTEEVIPDFVTLTQIANELGMSESDLASALNFNPGDTNSLILTDSVYMSFDFHDQLFYHTLRFDISSDFSNISARSWTLTTPNNTYLFDGGDFTSSNFEYLIKSNATSLEESMPSVFNKPYYLEKIKSLDILNKYDGKIILYLGNYYTLHVTTGSGQTSSVTFKPSDYTAWNRVCSQMEAYGGVTFNSALGEMYLETDELNCRLELSTYTPLTRQYETTISSSRKVCGKQEYDIVAIAYDTIDFLDAGNTVFSQDYDIGQKIASALALKEGTNVYDVQLLPYCPIPDIISSDKLLNLRDLTENKDFNYITYDDGGNTYKAGAVFYLDKASFNNRIEKSLISSEGAKIDSQCNFYRLVSPNYQGSFEFNVAKNGGSVEYFNIYCTYKPYTPFIKVTPNLKDLYGNDYNDNRGLLCGGDFSLPRASSAWQQYQLENKNYQNIFNREIQNLTFLQSIEMRNQIISGAVGVLADSSKGAVAGGMAGGPYGAIAGGILGATTSAVGFAVDTDTLAKTQRETRQLAIDKYNYQLGNIKALPYTLTKVGAFDISSKVFPFLEYYTCTDKEKDALRSKIKYESMTVMRIGTIEEFMNFEGTINYFKGELIRNDEIADDPHTFNAIYEELLKGVYI